MHRERERARGVVYTVQGKDQVQRQAQVMRADVPERRAWATRQGPGCASPAKGVGTGADWLVRPHLPRRASRFVSLSDLQPHRCLHPITKQYLATPAVSGNQSKTAHRNRWALRASRSRNDLPTARTSTYIPAGTSQVALPLSLPRLPCPTRSATLGNRPTANSLWRVPTSRCAAWAGIP